MKDENISQILYSLRTQRRVAQKDVCLGLCSIATYSSFENGVVLPDRLLLEALLQRLGKAADKLSTILSADEYRYFRWKRHVLSAFGRRDMNTLEQLLQEPIIEEIIINETLQQQFLYRMQALVVWQKDQNMEQSIALLEQAVEITMPKIYVDNLSSYLSSVEEMGILLDLCRLWVEGDRQKEALERLTAIVAYAESHYGDYEVKVKVLPKAVKQLYPLLLKENRDFEGLVLCQKAIDLLLWQGVLYDLAELIEGYLACSRNVKWTEKAEHYEKQLQALREIYQKYGGDSCGSQNTLLCYSNQEMYMVDEVVRQNRSKKAMSQELLSEGICTPQTLSRIECGKYAPNTKNFRALMKKLDIRHDYYNGKLYTSDFQLLEKQKQLERELSVRNWDKASELLKYLKSHVDMEEQQNQQILQAAENCILFFKHKITPLEYLTECQKLLGCQSEDWKQEDFWKPFLTNEKIIMLNHIAMIYGMEHQNEKTIFILEHLLGKLEESKISLTDRYESSVTVIGNLSTAYGEAGRFEECLEMCDKGIQLCLETGRGVRLPNFLINRAEAMVGISKASVEKSKKILKQAYYLSKLMGVHSATSYLEKYYQSRCEIDIGW